MQTILLSDRSSLRFLRSHHPNIYAEMMQRGLAKQDFMDEQSSVQFCGMIYLADGTHAVFLPRACHRNKELARITMEALARYGAEAKGRIFESDTGWGNSGLLAVIRRLADDFIRSGLYSERERIVARNVGKTDWGRTIRSITPVVAMPGDAAIYSETITTRSRDSNTVLITRIQACVIAEILRNHGWWISGLGPRGSILRNVPRPHHRRSIWPSILRRVQANLYSARSVDLVRDLIAYLELSRGQREGSMVFGLTDFHNVWEAMLRQTLKGVAEGWNARLPKPVYILRQEGGSETPQRGMQTDIIVEDSHGLHIIDAKYYAAASGKTAPGWADIAKQMFYEIAVRSVVRGEGNIRNSFVFPGSAQSDNQILHHVQMQFKDGQEARCFPRIECHYIDPERVMRSYISHRRDIEAPSSIGPHDTFA